MKLFNGDCLEVMKELPDNSIDFILTDLPYGTTDCKWDNIIDFNLMWKQIKRIRKQKSAVALFGTEPFSSYLRLSNIKEYKFDWVWNKKQAGNPLIAKYQPLRIFELIPFNGFSGVTSNLLHISTVFVIFFPRFCDLLHFSSS